MNVDFKEKWKTEEERSIIRIGCENSLKLFIRFIHKFTTNTDYVFKQFHNDIIKALESRTNNLTNKNLMINMPVGFGKSLIVEYYISWCFAKNKNNTFLYTSYSDKLITKLSKEVKDILESEPFNWLWGYKLKKDEKSKINWSIEGGIKRSGLTAGAMGGTITGLDAGNPAIDGYSGALIIDDPISATKVIFENARIDCVEKYKSGLKTRKRTSTVPIILIMQRLNEEDLAGYIIKKEKELWDIITVKAFEDGKSIWEEKISTNELKRLRENEPSVYLSQYQQEPNNNLSSLFSNAKYEPNEEYIYDGIGHIDKGFDGSDFTAFTIMKKIGNNIYAFGKLWDKHIDDCISDIIFFKNKYKCGTIHTEKNDDKDYFRKNNKDIIVKSYHEKMNKHYKIMTYLYSNWKNIYWIEETDSKYIDQIQSYTETSKHDDAPDSASSLCRLFSIRKTSISVDGRIFN